MFKSLSISIVFVLFTSVAAAGGDSGAPATSPDAGGPTGYAIVEASPELVAAIRADDTARVKAILGGGIKIDSEQDDSLGIAIHANGAQIVELLLEAGANVNSRDVYGCTPLTWAVYENRPDIVKRLLEKGARTDPPTGKNPLLAAVAVAGPDVVGALVHAGARLTVADRQGNTPLHIAARAGREEIVRILVVAGADPAARNRYGRTPLECATGPGKEAVAKILREAPATAPVEGTSPSSRPSPAATSRQSRE